MQVELSFGDSPVMLADEFPDMGVLFPLSVGGTATVLHLTVDDVDDMWSRAVAAGAEIRQRLGDVFWGERYGQITDPFGHRWGLAQHLRDVPREEWSGRWPRRSADRRERPTLLNAWSLQPAVDSCGTITTGQRACWAHC